MSDLRFDLFHERICHLSRLKSHSRIALIGVSTKTYLKPRAVRRYRDRLPPREGGCRMTVSLPTALIGLPPNPDSEITAKASWVAIFRAPEELG